MRICQRRSFRKRSEIARSAAPLPIQTSFPRTKMPSVWMLGGAGPQDGSFFPKNSATNAHCSCARSPKLYRYDITPPTPTRGDPDDKNPASEAGREGWAGLAAGFPPRSTWWRAGAAARWPDHHAGPARGRPNFIPLVGRLTSPGEARAVLAPGLARRSRIRRTPPRPTAPACANAASRRSSRSRKTRKPTAAAAAAPAAARPPSTAPSTRTATAPSGALPSNTGPWPPATTSGTHLPRHHQRRVNQELAPRPGHDPRDRPQGRRSRA